MTARDTIIALASGAGRAGVAVIRASGGDARAVCEALTGEPAPPDRRLSLRTLRRPDNGAEVLDRALVVYMPGPNSFTGEDSLEFHVHGGPAVVEAVLAAALSTGLCRPADAGEYTRRAFEGGKLDLVQAEALADLIDAETEEQRRQATAAIGGASSRLFERWRRHLVSVLSALEASIDFPDEADVPDAVDDRAYGPLVELQQGVEAALAGFDRGDAVREGFRISILGPPNAGKSSLLNRLARRDAAIVSPIPGTTRDIVEVRLRLGGFQVWLADSAGLRETADPVEAEGVRRALERAETAHLRLWVLDAGDPGCASALPPPPLLRSTDLVVLNKIDVGPVGPMDEDVFAVSARTGAGVDRLVAALEAAVVRTLSLAEPAIVSRPRHRELLCEALDHIGQALIDMDRRAGAEIVAESVRRTSVCLARLTGSIAADDVLDAIFGEFCIGK